MTLMNGKRLKKEVEEPPAQESNPIFNDTSPSIGIQPNLTFDKLFETHWREHSRTELPLYASSKEMVDSIYMNHMVQLFQLHGILIKP